MLTPCFYRSKRNRLAQQLTLTLASMSGAHS